MEFTFDPAKSDKNRTERGFGFAFAAGVFGGRLVDVIDWRRDYAELRVKAIGEVAGVLICGHLHGSGRRASHHLRPIGQQEGA